jgi:hypothetical protein
MLLRLQIGTYICVPQNSFHLLNETFHKIFTCEAFVLSLKGFSRDTDLYISEFQFLQVQIIHELSVSVQFNTNEYKPLPQMYVATPLGSDRPYCCTLHVPTPSHTWSGSTDGRNKNAVDCPSPNTRHLHHSVSRLSDQVGLSQTTEQLL